MAIGRDHQTEIAYSFLFFSFVVHFGNANFALAHSIEIVAVVTIFDKYIIESIESSFGHNKVADKMTINARPL